MALEDFETANYPNGHVHSRLGAIPVIFRTLHEGHTMRLIEWLLAKLFPTLDTPYGYSRRRLNSLRETETRLSR